MPSCAAPNCTNSSKKGNRLFRFPKDKKRRRIWIENCKREQWSPTACSVLCEGHFEETQFELHRLDGWKKLRPDAIPTIFGVANPPKKVFENVPIKKADVSNSLKMSDEADKITKERLENEHSYNTKPNDSYETPPEAVDNCEVDVVFSHRRCELKIKKYKSRTRALQRQNQKLRTELEYLNKNLQQFLTANQITHLKYNSQMQGRKGCIIPWDEETLSLTGRLFVSLGRRGYQYLRDTGYPMPSRRTLIRHRMSREKSVGTTDHVVDDEDDDDKSNESFDPMDDLIAIKASYVNMDRLPLLRSGKSSRSQMPNNDGVRNYTFDYQLLKHVDEAVGASASQ